MACNDSSGLPLIGTCCTNPDGIFRRYFRRPFWGFPPRVGALGRSATTLEKRYLRFTYTFDNWDCAGGNRTGSAVVDQLTGAITHDTGDTWPSAAVEPTLPERIRPVVNGVTSNADGTTITILYECVTSGEDATYTIALTEPWTARQLVDSVLVDVEGQPFEFVRDTFPNWADAGRTAGHWAYIWSNVVWTETQSYSYGLGDPTAYNFNDVSFAEVNQVRFVNNDASETLLCVSEVDSVSTDVSTLLIFQSEAKFRTACSDCLFKASIRPSIANNRNTWANVISYHEPRRLVFPVRADRCLNLLTGDDEARLTRSEKSYDYNPAP